ncbi:mercury methylation ferredoxin HgcB [candidate division KSB1 bacterium]
MFNAYAVNTLKFNNDLCNNCIICSTVCPHKVFTRTKGIVNLSNPENCMECGACQKNCPLGAITVESGTGCAYALMKASLSGKDESSCSC